MPLRTVWGVHARFGLISKSLAFTQHTVRYKQTKAGKANVPVLTLRPYQEDAVNACLDALQQGIKHMAVSMPPGSGKTAVLIALLHELRLQGKARNSLILVKSPVLTGQIERMINRMYPKTSVEIEQGKHSASGRADITIATAQSLHGDRLEKFRPGLFKAIVVDEAHHADTDSHVSVLSHFDPGVGGNHPSTPIFGFSATIRGLNGESTVSVFEKIVYHLDFLKMIEGGHLCDLKFTVVKMDTELLSTQSKQTSVKSNKLAKIMNTDAFDQLLVQSWEDNAGDRKRTLVLLTGSDHLHDLTQAFRKRGHNAKYIYQGTSEKNRHQLLDDFNAGKLPILLSCGSWMEGLDMPAVDCIVQARPTKYKNILVQTIGRGMRRSPETGKQDCHIIEFMDIHGRFDEFKLAPSMFGLDPRDLESGSGLLASLKERPTKLPEQNPSTNASFYGDLFNDDNGVSIRNPYAEQEERMVELSPMAWVACGHKYILQIIRMGQVEIVWIRSAQNQDSSWSVIFRPSTEYLKSYGSQDKTHKIGDRLRVVVKDASFLDAVKAADNFVQDTFPYELENKLLRTSGWRSLQISQGQHDLLGRTLGISERRIDPSLRHVREWCNVHTLEDISRLKKGEATDLIIRLKAEFMGILSGPRSKPKRP